MKSVTPDGTWPESWNYCYRYDLQEVYGQIENYGYVYAYENRLNHAFALIEEVIPPGGRILDVAAAKGNLSLKLAERGYRVTWNDIREDLLDYVKLKYEHGDIRYAPGNIFDLRFDEPFDCVLAAEIIEHVAHPDEFLAKLSELVNPGGYIVVTTPNGAYFRNDLPRFSEFDDTSIFESDQFKPNADGHIFLLWKDEIVKLCNAAGLKVDRLEVFTSPLTSGHVKLEFILPLMPRKIVFSLESAVCKLPPRVKERLMVQTAVRLRKV